MDLRRGSDLEDEETQCLKFPVGVWKVGMHHFTSLKGIFFWSNCASPEKKIRPKRHINDNRNKDKAKALRALPSASFLSPPSP